MGCVSYPAKTHRTKSPLESVKACCKQTTASTVAGATEPTVRLRRFEPLDTAVVGERAHGVIPGWSWRAQDDGTLGFAQWQVGLAADWAGDRSRIGRSDLQAC